MDQPVAPNETELKFTLEATDLAAFKALSFLAEARVTNEHLEAIYLDTEDCRLFQAGYSLRLRREGDRWRQTLKGRAQMGGGLFVRPETETEIADGTVDLAALASGLPGALLAEVAGRLTPRFTVNVERAEWLVTRPEGLVSVSCDVGEIVAGERREPVREVEFELRSGRPEALFSLAREAVATVALQVAPLAKSDRGYRLIGIDPPKVDEPALTGDLPAISGFRLLARTLLAEVAIWRDAVMASGAVEPVHRLRVTLRRLRSLLDFLPDDMATPKLATVAAEMRTAFRQLGVVRDLDILAAAIPQNAIEADAALARVGEERVRELEGARAILASRRFAAATLDLLLFMEEDDHDPKAASGKPLRAVARRLLKRQWRRLRHMPPLDALSDKRRHRIRIRAKRFRFASDVFGAIFMEGKAARRRNRIETALKDLQDELGRLNDRRNVEELARAHLGRPVATVLGLGKEDASKDNDLETAAKARRRLLRRRAYWR